jgi:hypothetical protein
MKATTSTSSARPVVLHNADMRGGVWRRIEEDRRRLLLLRLTVVTKSANLRCCFGTELGSEHGIDSSASKEEKYTSTPTRYC